MTEADIDAWLTRHQLAVAASLSDKNTAPETVEAADPDDFLIPDEDNLLQDDK